MKSIQIIEITPEELSELISKGVKKELDIFRKELLHQQGNDELLSRDQTCEFLQINSSTLWSWTNKGKVKAYSIANRRYYKRSELIESLKQLEK